MSKTIQRGNGQGSVYKLSGNRRKPWRAIITKGWDTSSDKSVQIRETIGYYETRDDALQALINYNKNPYDISGGKATFSEVYSKWSEKKYTTISQSNVKGYTAAYRRCSFLYDMPFKDIGLDDLQYTIENADVNYPTMRKIKILFNQMYSYAMPRGLCDKDYSDYVDISQYKDKNPNAQNRTKISDADVKKIV